MIIYLKNKHTLQINDFNFKCSIGKNGLTTTKKEGDKKTPKGIFRLGNLYYRKDRLNLKNSKLKKIKIKPNMGWCDDINNPKNYNKLITKNSKIHHEKLYRKDHKYDLIIPIKYNFTKPEIKKGSCIFIHMTQNYKPTAGCIALNKYDLMIMLRLINKKTKIHIQ